MSESLHDQLIPTGDATAILPLPGNDGKPITVIGSAAIRDTFEDNCLQQAINSRLAPGVTDLVLNPDAHVGYGAPVGCAMASPTHIYPARSAWISSAPCRCSNSICPPTRSRTSRFAVR